MAGTHDEHEAVTDSAPLDAWPPKADPPNGYTIEIRVRGQDGEDGQTDVEHLRAIQSHAVELRTLLDAVGGQGVRALGKVLDELLAQITAAVDGREAPAPDGREPAPRSGLTPVEADVVRLVAIGHTNREAAHLLDVPMRTVEARRARAMTKLGATSRAELVRLAYEHGLVDRP